MKVRLFALTLVLALLDAPAARSDPATEARFFDELARKSYAAGRFEEAMDLFLRSEEAAHNPRTLYNLGLCAERLGQRAEAFGFFAEFLRESNATPELRAEAEAHVEGLRADLFPLAIDSEPRGATIYVDRPELGAYGRTAKTIALPFGEHEIILELEDHVPARRRVDAAKTGAPNALFVALEPEKGTLVIDASPIGAKITVSHGDASVFTSTIARALELPGGRYRVRVEAPGHERAEVEAIVRKAAIERVALAAAKKPPPVGELLIACEGVAAEIVLDGEVVMRAPAKLVRIRAGRHRLELRAPGFRTWRRELDVVEGETSYVSVTMIPE